MKNSTPNIENLTRLWQIAGQAFNGFEATIDYRFSTIKDTDWPHRIWTHRPLTPTALHAIKKRMHHAPNCTFSIFDTDEATDALMTAHNFKLKFLQYGMSRPLTTRFHPQRTIELVPIKNKTHAQLWSKTFFEAFKYCISAETLLRSTPPIQYLLVKHEATIVGTIAVLVTNKTAGIHSLGIVPHQRNKGFATTIMQHVLNDLLDQNCAIATLQASKMAKNLYLKLGFTVDFLMKNYLLNIPQT